MCARANQNLPTSWYNRYNTRHSKVYARTADWQTRRGRRNQEYYQFRVLHGLDTANDDMNKQQGLSPYLRNARFMGERTSEQRAQVTSRFGAKFLAAYGDVEYYHEASESEVEIPIWEGRTIKFPLKDTTDLVGGQIFVRNTGGARGILIIHAMDGEDGEEVASACIHLDKIPHDKFVSRMFRGINKIAGNIWIRLEVYDDIDITNPYSNNPIRSKIIHVLGTGAGYRYEADYELPNTDEALREIPYNYVRKPGIPMLGTLTNHTEALRGTYLDVWSDDYKYTVFAAKENGTVYLFRYNHTTHKITRMSAPVAGTATAVRMVQCEKYIYYVDGISPLRRIDIPTWKSEDVIPKCEDIDIDTPTEEDCEKYIKELTPKAGASLILFWNNKIVLSGFKDDPNLVTYSMITSKMASDYVDEETGEEGVKIGILGTQFRDRFYSPNRSTEQSKGKPVTALAEYDGITLAIFREDGMSLYSAPEGMTYGQVKQEDTFNSVVGVAYQEDVCSVTGSIFYYNKSEGVRRFSGSSSSFTSSEVDNELSALDPDAPRYMVGHANKIRLYFPRGEAQLQDHCLIYDTRLTGSGPWYMDNNTPVMWANPDQKGDRMVAMHSGYICLMEVDSLNNNTDFETPIIFEYYTDYRQSVDPSGWARLERVFTNVVASATHSWFIGIDKDHSDNPAVWRKIVVAMEDIADAPEDQFQNVAPAGRTTVSCQMKMQVREFQVRWKVIVYNAQAELLGGQGEAGIRESF